MKITFHQGMNKALKARVPGLGTTTIKDVFDKLKQNGCICLQIGGSVRDQFLGGKVSDIDAESPCDVHKIVEICTRHWGKTYCNVSQKTEKVQIVQIGEDKGDGEKIDLGNWNKFFFGSLTNLEYTTNSLGYYDDAVNNRGIVIDFSGSGVNDTCNKVIRIPVPRDQWDDWYSGYYWKIFRYWKLLAKGYDAEGDELPSFIKKKTKDILKTTNGRNEFKISFFKYSLSGDYIDDKNIAIVPYPTCSNIAQQNEKKRKYHALYQKVLGEYWENEVKELVDKIKIECPSQTVKGSSGKTQWSLILTMICVLIQCAVWQDAS